MARRKKQWCKKCNNYLPIEEYSINKAGILDRVCSHCKKKSREAPKRKKSVALYTEDRNNYLLRKYGLTLSDYNLMFDSQRGSCAICKRHQGILESVLAVDHDHKTGKTRRLLCTRCNTALGQLEDDIELLQSMIDYLIIFKTR